MKGLRAKIIYILLIILITVPLISIVISGHNKSTYSSYAYMNNVNLCANESEAYLIGSNGNQVYIDAVCNSKFSISFSTNISPSSYKLFNDTVVALCPSEYETEVYLYDIKSQIISVITLNQIAGNFADKYAYDGTYFYYINGKDSIRKISTNGRLINEYKTDRDILSLVCDFNNNVYAVCDKGLYLIDSESKLISDSTYFKHVEFIGENYFVDGNNSVYQKAGNNINYAGNFVSNNKNKFGGVTGNHIIVADNYTIYALDNSNCEKTKSCVLSTYIDDICVVADKIIILSYSEGVPQILIVNSNELKDVSKQDTIADNKISSDTYTIDNDSKIIYNIPATTTVAVFKKNVNYEGFDISFVRYDNKKLDSGKLGTNATVTFNNDKETYTYTLSVIGEVTGEGNVNSRDIKAVARFILKTEEYNNAQKTAADINKNGAIDIVDLAHFVTLSNELK